MAIEVTDASFEQEVIQEKEKHVLVDFWAEWCGPCKMLAPVIEEIGTKLESKLKVCKLDTDKSQDTAQKYQITGIPCCILFSNGEEKGRIVGYRSAEAMETELNDLIG